MEFCPVCMLRKGLAGGVESGGSSASEDIRFGDSYFSLPCCSQYSAIRLNSSGLAERWSSSHYCRVHAGKIMDVTLDST